MRFQRCVSYGIRQGTPFSQIYTRDTPVPPVLLFLQIIIEYYYDKVLLIVFDVVKIFQPTKLEYKRASIPTIRY